MDISKIQKENKNNVISIRITDEEIEFVRTHKINPAKLFREALKELSEGAK